jgi:hypothetical protein
MTHNDFWFWAFVVAVACGLVFTAAREWHIAYINKQVRGLQDILSRVADNICGVEDQLKDETKEIKDSLRELRNMLFSAAMGRFGINISGSNTQIGDNNDQHSSSTRL